MEKKFKCKDEVIYRRNYEEDEWTYGIFSHYHDNFRNAVVNGVYITLDSWDILPYEGNEHLVGTDQNTDEEVRLEEGEYLMGCCEIELEHPQYWNIGKYVKNLHKDCFLTDCGSYIYAVKFSDFNPSNMEETKKHILCVRNGKIVKYRG